MPDLTPEREVASREAIARRPARKSRGLKAVGLLGFVCLGLMLVLAGIAIAAGATDRDATVWLAVGAVVMGLLAIGLLIGSRVLLRRRAARDGDRAHQDPIQPETTAEEAERYEERFHDFPVEHAGKSERGRDDRLEEIRDERRADNGKA
ncbi:MULTISPECIES: hypothetical protein [Gordonia]|uniref:hypothetical protein n=1 Tax=Gordonia TaxID=2053 RepID=UPI00071C39CB|nr:MULTISPECIES: hypothetical protein [unclassified Gordonia (in: high G+C Gram-positive bacteria)]KSU61203.1 hypothetical protein AS181_00870 [Gordonia sp. SGD-V-85]SCB75170.1 hypothetical protein GA0061091_101178 [Gordonia sp. v-85]